MREVELKSAVTDIEACIARVEEAGGVLLLKGVLKDSRYDTPERALGHRDETLRVRSFRDASKTETTLDWKGPSREEGGYKVREEISTTIGDEAALVTMLELLGYTCIMAIDREITQFQLDGATIRFERYPRMDTLVEVEGTPADIEQAIGRIGLPRDGFTTERLGAFVSRFEARTGAHAALCHAELDK